MANALNTHLHSPTVFARALYKIAITPKLKDKLHITYLKQSSNVLSFIYKVLWKHLFTLRQTLAINEKRGRFTAATYRTIYQYRPMTFFFPLLFQRFALPENIWS